MRGRDTKNNVKEIKEEINDMMIRDGQKKAIGSLTQLSHKCENIAENMCYMNDITK